MRFLVALTPLALIACGTPATENTAAPEDNAAASDASATPTVTNAWIRLPAVPGRPAAAYFTLNGGAADDAVVSVTTPAAQRTELHESMEHGGVMSMDAIENVPLGTGAAMDFAPGGKHVMLFDMPGDLAVGGTTDLTVTFRDAPAVTVPATLVAPGGDAPAASE